MRSLLQTLEVEDFVEQRDGRWSLTPFGAAAAGDLRGWFQLFLDAYGEFIRNAAALWAGKPDPSWRDMRSVGLASVRISEHGALPLVSQLITKHCPDAQMVVDVGCADATYLAALCAVHPTLRGIGIEPDERLREEAHQTIEQRGLSDRVHLVPELSDLATLDLDPDVFVFGFSLHEMVEQQGEDAVKELLADIGVGHPGALLLAAEADYSKRDDLAAMRADPHLRGYYNWYYMLHDFTDQVLLTRDQWRALFDDAGLTILDEPAIDPAFDPTGLEVVFALRPSSSTR